MRETSATAARPTPKGWQRAGLIVFLAVLPVAALWPVLRNDFVSYDDDVYVTRNPPVQRGLTWAGVRWAFTTGHGANWHPLTWLSHMADASVFGMNASGHHATNLLLHVVNTLLLFLVFRTMTADPWRSAWIAAVFAVHPAHVESVAWVAERKDLLSAMFWLATLGAYVSWTRNRTLSRYLAVCLLFAAGLMSKPMLVSLPFTLLLLDYWPLRRWTDAGAMKGRRVWTRLLLEKAPLFMMAAASSVVTVLVQRAGGAVGSLQSYPLGVRLANALVAYVRYLRIFVWPADLAVFYPHPGASLSGWEIGTSAFLLVAISAAAIRLRRRAPFLIVGWLWFLVTLLPVIGLVQVGLQAMADRYTYVPFIGLLAAVAWGVPLIASRWRAGGFALRAAGAAAVLALAVIAAGLARSWKNSETLYLRAIAVTGPNFLAQNNLGDYYNETGRPVEAMPHLQEAIRIRPAYAEAYTNLGRSLFLMGRLDEAAQHFQESARLRPDNAVAIANLAWTRLEQGEIPSAIPLYRRALARIPESVNWRKRLSMALLLDDRPAEAIEQLDRATALDPWDVEARNLLAGAAAFQQNRHDSASEQMRRALTALHRKAGAALQARGKRKEAAAQFRAALALSPESIEAHTDLGALLFADGRLDEAAAEFQRAVKLDPRSALAHNNVGYVCYLQGKTDAALAEYREALRLQPDLELARMNLEKALSQKQKRESTDAAGH